MLDEIAAKVAADYPCEAGYRYVFEKAIPGTRMMPDILVTRGGRYICAVEIGYTRPEKLTAYRHRFKIADVRWYDKSGQLHADVTETHIRVSAKVTAAPTREMSVYQVRNWVSCVGCPALRHAFVRRVPDRAAERFIRRFGEEAFSERDVEAVDEYDIEMDDVITCVVTDHVNIWLPSYCDKCDRDWLADPRDDADLLAWACEGTVREVGLALGARRVMSWDDARAAVLDVFGLTLDYLDGHFLKEEDEFNIRREIQVAVHTEVDHARQPKA